MVRKGHVTDQLSFLDRVKIVGDTSSTLQSINGKKKVISENWEHVKAVDYGAKA